MSRTRQTFPGIGSKLVGRQIRMPRFKIDDVVEINSVIISKRTGQRGQIKKVIPNKEQIRTLDRYVVVFGTDRETFSDIQLVLVSQPTTS